MSEARLYELLLRWAKGDRVAADEVFVYLWQILTQTISMILIKKLKIDTARGHDCAIDGFLNTMERFDWHHSGGKVYWEDKQDPHTGDLIRDLTTREVVKVGAFTGQEHPRHRQAFQWKDLKVLKSLRGWVVWHSCNRGIERFRHETHYHRPQPEKTPEGKKVNDGSIPRPMWHHKRRTQPFTNQPTWPIETPAKSKEGIYQQIQTLLRLIGRLQSTGEGTSDTSKSKRYICCVLHLYIVQAIWHACPTQRRTPVRWNSSQDLTNDQCAKLLGMLDVPIETLLSYVDLSEVVIDAGMAREFIWLWVKRRLTHENPTALNSLTKARNTHLDAPIKRLRDKDDLDQIAPWFFN